MRITISALGPIHDEAEFELKPLTIFIGPNNSGKTLLAYTLAAIFGKFGISQFTDPERTNSILKNYPPVASAVNGLLKNRIVSLDIYQFAVAYGKQYFADIISTVRTNLHQFMGTRSMSFKTPQIELYDLQPLLLKHIQDIAFHALIPIEPDQQDGNHTNEKHSAPFRISKQRGQNDIKMFLTFEDQLEAGLPEEHIRLVIEKQVIQYVFSTLHHALFCDVAILPTERTTFLAQPFITLPDQEVNQIRDPDIRPLARPVSYYITCVIALTSIGKKETDRREQEAKKSPQVENYRNLARFLEEAILNGKVSLSTEEPGPNREILFHPNDCEYPLEISLASSMVKELAPLVFHLRYFAQPNELLIIDEPEMNLHPKAQVQVLEFLAMLANAGLNVLITTHSPYITDHLLNLTKAKQHPEPEAIVSRFFLQDQQAFISDKDVSFYLIDQGKIIDATDETADWNTFGKVSDLITDIYLSFFSRHGSNEFDSFQQTQ
jgi:energy-coupling factor transporter ATP-binding protein EcfA2